MPTKNYHEELIKQLQDVEEAAEYLSACYEESEEIFLLGLRNVVEAQGGVGELAKLTNLNRENIYRMLSDKGNPAFSSLTSILDALGIQLQFAAKEEEKEAA